MGHGRERATRVQVQSGNHPAQAAVPSAGTAQSTHAWPPPQPEACPRLHLHYRGCSPGCHPRVHSTTVPAAARGRGRAHPRVSGGGDGERAAQRRRVRGRVEARLPHNTGHTQASRQAGASTRRNHKHTRVPAAVRGHTHTAAAAASKRGGAPAAAAAPHAPPRSGRRYRGATMGSGWCKPMDRPIKP